jgi:REP element-mobilizing transposase RayT
MSTGYQIRDQAALHYLTIQVVDWIDVFTRQAYRDIVLESLRYCMHNKGLQIFGYVIMSNHIHIITNSPGGELSNTLRDFKKFTAKNIIESIIEGNESRKEWMLNRFQFNAQRHSRNENYQMWTHENHAVVIYSPQFAREKLEYLHRNPVRSGIVRRPEDYIYSSASNYAEMESILEIVRLDVLWKTYF